MDRPCSIVIPTYNRPELLVRAVNSAIAAIPEDGEIIVVDDGSDTPAQDALANIADPRLQVLHSDVPLGGGGSPSRNKGAKIATGRVLFFLDDDDEMLPHYCASILSNDVTETAEFGFCRRQFTGVTANGSSDVRPENRQLPDGLVAHGTPFSKRTFPFSAGFWITKTAYEHAGPLAETLSTNSDTEYCCRLYGLGLQAWYSAEPGVIIHDHAPGAAFQMKNVTKRTKAADRAASFRYMAEHHKRYLEQDPTAALFIHERWLKHAHRAGQTDSASEAVSSAPHLKVRAKLRLKHVGLNLRSMSRAQGTL